MFKQNNSNDKKTNFLIFVAYYCTIIVAAFLSIKFLIPFLMPFLIGFTIAFILKPLTKIISKKTHISHKICGAAVVILSYCLLTTSIWLVCIKVISTIQSFTAENQGIFVNRIMPTIKNLSYNFSAFCDNIAPNLGFKTEEVLEKIAGSIDKTIADTSKMLIIYAAKIGSAIPNFLINLTFAVTSSIYISTDYLKMAQTLDDITPKNLKKFIQTIKIYTTNTIIKYLKAYSLLTIISFISLSIGFLIIKIKNPIGIAALISICDLIPLLGSNIVVFPWIIILILLNNFSLAIKIGIIFAIVNIFRGFLEPKIIGTQIGLHPVITLITFYIGMKLFGFLGLILIPTIAQIGFTIYKQYNTEFKKMF